MLNVSFGELTVIAISFIVLVPSEKFIPTFRELIKTWHYLKKQLSIVQSSVEEHFSDINSEISSLIKDAEKVIAKKSDHMEDDFI